MMRLLLFNRLRSNANNTAYLSFKKFCNKPQVTEKESTASDVDDASKFISQRLHAPNNLDKKILVWTGMYKSREEIPKRVTVEAIEKAKNKARIKLSNYMILATIIACIGFAISGRRAAKRGESVTQMNLDWHKQIKEEAAKSQK